MDSESNKKQKLDNVGVGGQDVETVKAFDKPRAPLTATAGEIKAMLDAIEKDILPQTEASVSDDGNKVFGAAILNPDFTCSVAATNSETDSPLFHGEVKCIYDWSKCTKSSERGPLAQSSIFLCTHEPCCMCVASILWSGFNKIYYWLPYATTTAQGIPHDIKTMHELWGVKGYRRQNKYFSAAGLLDLIEQVEDKDAKNNLISRSANLLEKYNKLSDQYHREKADNENNSLVLG